MAIVRIIGDLRSWNGATKLVLDGEAWDIELLLSMTAECVATSFGWACSTPGAESLHQESWRELELMQHRTQGKNLPALAQAAKCRMGETPCREENWLDHLDENLGTDPWWECPGQPRVFAPLSSSPLMPVGAPLSGDGSYVRHRKTGRVQNTREMNGFYEIDVICSQLPRRNLASCGAQFFNCRHLTSKSFTSRS